MLKSKIFPSGTVISLCNQAYSHGQNTIKIYQNSLRALQKLGHSIPYDASIPIFASNKFKDFQIYFYPQNLENLQNDEVDVAFEGFLKLAPAITNSVTLIDGTLNGYYLTQLFEHYQHGDSIIFYEGAINPDEYFKPELNESGNISTVNISYTSQISKYLRDFLEPLSKTVLVNTLEHFTSLQSRIDLEETSEVFNSLGFHVELELN